VPKKQEAVSSNPSTTKKKKQTKQKQKDPMKTETNSHDLWA
jgi:hypothetical protein